MVEIIKIGTKQIGKCKKCGCEFSYEVEDVVKQEINNEINAKVDAIICPQCGTPYILYAEK